jgi:hypothetical protein
LISTSTKEAKNSLVAKYLQLLPDFGPDISIIRMGFAQFGLEPVHVIQLEPVTKQSHTPKDVGQPSPGLNLSLC